MDEKGEVRKKEEAWKESQRCLVIPYFIKLTAGEKISLTGIYQR